MKNLMVLFLLLISVFIFVAGCSAKHEPSQKQGPDVVADEYIDAQELKLRVRELADQMLTTQPGAELAGTVAMPVSFVNQQDFQETSALGRYMAEGLIYEFNQRGLPIREYRLAGNITSDAMSGNFALSRELSTKIPKSVCTVLVIGTYLRDKKATFINARMVRASDGMVLRTGQIVLMNTPIIDRLSSQISFEPEQKKRKNGHGSSPSLHSTAPCQYSNTPPPKGNYPGGMSAGGQPVSGSMGHNPNCITENPNIKTEIPASALCSGTLAIKPSARSSSAQGGRSHRKRR